MLRNSGSGLRYAQQQAAQSTGPKLDRIDPFSLKALQANRAYLNTPGMKSITDRFTPQALRAAGFPIRE